MRYLLHLIIISSMMFFLNGCGSSHSQNNQGNVYVPEVNGPAGGFVGATKFDAAMFADWQTLYTYDENHSIWIGVVFNPNGDLIFESTGGIENGGTYSVIDGKLMIQDSEKSPTIALDVAKATVWEVTGTDNDGHIWQDTWHLELKFKLDMLIGNYYESNYVFNGENITEILNFTASILTVYTPEGKIKHIYPYQLKDNAIVINGGSGAFTLHLMSIDQQNNLGVWYVSESDNYANDAIWTPINN